MHTKKMEIVKNSNYFFLVKQLTACKITFQYYLIYKQISVALHILIYFCRFILY